MTVFLATFLIISTFACGFCNAEAAIATEKSASEEIDTNQPLHTHNTSALFYRALHDTMARESSIKVYTKRVDCIVEELEKASAMRGVSTEHYNFTLDQNGALKVDAFAGAKIMEELESAISRENINCIIPGAIALVLIVCALVILVSCTACLSRRDYPMKFY